MGRGGVAGRNRTRGASRFRRPLYRAELRPHVSGQGWTRTSSLLFVRQALCAIELLARRAPGQGFEPRPPRSERGVLAVRRSRKETVSCSCHSPTLRPWIAAARPLPRVFVEAFWSPALVSRGKYAGKSSCHVCSVNYRVSAGEDLSLSGGASIQSLVFFKLSITSCSRRFAFKRMKATLSGRPRFELLCG